MFTYGSLVGSLPFASYAQSTEGRGALKNYATRIKPYINQLWTQPSYHVKMQCNERPYFILKFP